MFKSIRNALKVKEIRMKILFTLAMIAVIRFGTTVPIPGTEDRTKAIWQAGKGTQCQISPQPPKSPQQGLEDA